MPVLSGCGAGAVLNGQFYVIGGYNGTVHIDSVHVYNPTTNVWSVAPSLLTPRAGLAAVVLDETIYAIGGGNTGGLQTANEAFTPPPSAPPGVIGDLNGDEKVNVLDVIRLVGMIIGRIASPAPGSADFAVADVNGDETINIQDVVQMITSILRIEE